MTLSIGKYKGSKAAHTTLFNHIPETRGIIETHGGSGAILMNIQQRPFEVYNDLSPRMFALFDMLLKQPEALIRMVDSVPYSDWTLATAVEMEQSGETIDIAFSTIVRLWMSRDPFKTSGGSFRKKKQAYQGKKGNTESPLQHQWARLPERLDEIHGRIKKWMILNWDAAKCVEYFDSLNSDNLMIHDLPYLAESRDNKAKVYDIENMNEAGHEKFIKKVLATKHTMHIFTHYRHPLYDQLLVDNSGYVSVEYEASTDGRTRREAIYICPKAWTRLRQQRRQAERQPRLI